jgi:hypothetical protein
MTAVWPMLMPLAGSRKIVPVCASSAEVPERQPVHLHGRRRDPKRRPARSAPRGLLRAAEPSPHVPDAPQSRVIWPPRLRDSKCRPRPWAGAECASLTGRGIQRVDSRKSRVPPPESARTSTRRRRWRGSWARARRTASMSGCSRSIARSARQSPLTARSVMTFPGHAPPGPRATVPVPPTGRGPGPLLAASGSAPRRPGTRSRPVSG